MFSEVVLASEQRTRTRRFVAGVSPALLNGGHFARPRLRSLLSFRSVPFATADFCKNMPSCIFDVLQKRHFLQKIKLGEIP